MAARVVLGEQVVVGERVVVGGGVVCGMGMGCVGRAGLGGGANLCCGRELLKRRSGGEEKCSERMEKTETDYRMRLSEGRSHFGQIILR